MLKSLGPKTDPWGPYTIRQIRFLRAGIEMESGKKRSVFLFYSLTLLMIFVVMYYISTNERTISINIAFKTITNMSSVISDKVVENFQYAKDTFTMRFKPNQTNQRKKVRLVIGILSWFKKHDRRNASRSTWLKWGINRTDEVAYRYFCDSFDRSLVENQVIVEEEKMHNDIVNFPFSGWVFSNNQVYMMRYFTERYDFDFFMKTDDDYFVCLERLLFDMSYLINDHKRIWWGWGHCSSASTWVDEGMNVLSADLIKEFMEKYNNKTLMCGFMADLSIGTWLQESSRGDTMHFFDNDRIVHSASDNDVKNILKTKVCRRYLGIHQAYPDRMLKYWNKAIHIRNRRFTNFTKVKIEGFKHYCGEKRILNLNAFKGSQFYRPPKPCNEIPSWGGHKISTNTYRQNG